MLASISTAAVYAGAPYTSALGSIAPVVENIAIAPITAIVFLIVLFILFSLI